MLTRLLLTGLLFLLCQNSALAVDPSDDWKTIESEHFYVHHAKKHIKLANRAAVIAERAHQRLTKELDWTPRENTHLVLSDETDFANGFANVLGFNHSVLYISPPDASSVLNDFDDWLTTLITHEYTHVIHLDKAAGAPKNLRGLFGRVLFFFPNLLQPAWMIEGLATHKETDRERKIGRGQSAGFSSMMRMEVVNGISPVSQVNISNRTWPGGTTRYLYGVYFMRFVSETYGEEKLQQLIEEYSDNILPFFINHTFYKVFNKDVTEIWKEFKYWLQDSYEEEINTIKAGGLIEGNNIGTNGYNNNRVLAVGDTVYVYEFDGSHEPRIVKIDNDEREVLFEVNGGTSFDVDPEGNILLSQLEYCNEFKIFYDLYFYNRAEDDLVRLTECGRYKRARFHPDNKHIIAVKHDSSEFELVQLDNHGKLEKVLWESTNGDILSDFDIDSAGNELAVSIWRPTHGWNIELFNLESASWKPLTENANIQAFPAYSPDDKSIYYSNESDDAFNLVRYDVESGDHFQVSNVLGSAYQSSQGKTNGPLYYSGYTANGNDIYKIDNVFDIMKVYQQDSRLQTYSYPEVSFTQQDYSAWQSLSPTWWLPFFNFNEDNNEWGFSTSGHDALSLHRYALTLGYDSSNKYFIGDAVYRYSNWFSIGGGRENHIYRFDTGQFDRARPSDYLQLSLAVHDTSMQSRSDYLFAVATDKSADKRLGPFSIPVNETRDSLLGLAWLYNNSRHYPLSISANDGRAIRLVAEDSDTLKSDFIGQVYSLEWNEYIRLGGEHVLALQFLQGYGTDQPKPFRLGGEESGLFYNEFLEAVGRPVFGRRKYALRGYAEGLPQLEGRRARVFRGEYRFPLTRPETSIMIPPVGVSQFSGSLFVDSGAVYDLDQPEKYYTGAGLELNADLAVFYHVNFRARFGYAHGFDDIGDNRYYVSLGASF